jgi:beta-glucanase (GH16 family)
VEATDGAGTSAASSAVSVTTSGSGGGEAPYPGPAAAAVPGTVLAENYDTGGQGVGYNVTSTNGTANTYRTGGVDLEAATAPATGNDLGWSAAGQWFRYTVNAATAGTYTVSFLVASPAAVTDGFHLSNSSGTNLTGSVAVPATGGYQTWVTVTASVTLPAGTQTLTLNDDAAGWNIDSMALQCSSCGGEGPYPGPAAPAIPGTVLNENYDTGGQGVAYNVTSTNGTANTYRAQGVDLEAATAPATGNDLGWSAAGQWFRYTVNASTAGTYTVSFLVASPAAVTDGFHLSNSSGTNLTGSVNVPATGGYQTWATVTATVTLPAGQQTLTLNDDAAGWNIDSMAFTSGSGGGCTTKPNAPAGLSASGTTSSGTNLSWATDSPPANCSISSYTVLKNGASIGTATGPSFAVTGLSASTNYSFTVEATDAAGTSAASSAVSVTTSGTGGGGYVPIANGSGFTLTPQNNTGLDLDNSNWGIGSGNPIDVLNPNGSVSQAFYPNNGAVTPAGDYNFGVQGANCMSVSGTTSGSAVVITGCGGTPAQAWAATLVSTAPYLYTFSPSTATGLCLTASGSGSGNAAVVDTCNGSSSQQWGLTADPNPGPPPQGPITNGGYSLIPQNNTGLMLDDSNSGTGNGNPINVTTPASSVAQNWALSDNGVTPLTYYNLATIGAFCMDTSGTTSGSAVVLDGCAGLPGQAWEAVVSGSNYVFHPASNTALCLTASGTASGSAVVVDSCNGSTSQQWALGPIAAPGPIGPPPPDCATYGVPNLTVGGRTYTPTWCTEFNGAAGPAPTAGYGYDLGNNGGWGNGELEVYCGPPGYPTNPVQCPTTFSTSTAPVYIDGNGHLVIQPRNVGGTWLSGRLVTSNSATGGNTFQYGIIEASIQLQDMNPEGLWPAFWGLGNNIYSNVAWPNCGETDILEDWSPSVLGGAGDAGENSTIHTMDTGGTGIGARYTFPSGQAVNTGFHTYGMIWSANEIQYFVDNPSAPFETLTSGNLPAGDVWPFNQPIFIILNEAVGGLLGGTAPASTPGPMLVDYVRYYQ